MKGIDKKYHGVLDYVYVPAVLKAPSIGKFASDKNAARICYSFAAITLAYTLLTDARWGVVKIIPYKTHLTIDVVSGTVALVLAVSRRNTNNKAARAFLIMGFAGLVAGTLSIVG